MSSSLPVGVPETGPVAALYHDPAPVGAVAVSLLLGTYGLFGRPVDLPLVIAGFCGVTVVYAADRAWGTSPEDRVNRPGRVAWVRAHRDWLAIETAGLFALGGAMLPYLERESLLWMAVLGGVTAPHVWPWSRARPLLRGFAKPGAIAGAWAAGAGVLPLVEAGDAVGTGALLFCAYRALFILPNLLVADWADRQGDADAGLMPWASKWTLRRTRWVATGLLLAAALGAVVWMTVGTMPLLVAIDAAGLGLMGGAVWGLDPSRPRGAFLTDLVVAWPLVTALAAWMIV